MLNQGVQRGFTLIELMVSLVLGLLITAATLQIFYTSSVSNSIQQAGFEVVDNNTFGFDDFIKQVRKANYGALPNGTTSSFFLNHQTPLGGIVLSTPTDLKVFGNTIEYQNAKGQTVTDTVPSNLRGISIENNVTGLAALVTQAESPLSSSHVTTSAGTALNSDQLTIQYQAALDNQLDCRGRAIMQGDYVIERYFVRDGGLACASAIYTYNPDVAKKDANNQNAIDISKYRKPIKDANGKFQRDAEETEQNLADDGEIVIPNVDYFGVLLGVSESKDFSIDPTNYDLQYIRIPERVSAEKKDQYPTLMNKRIVSLQIALLVRSDGSVKASNDPQFDVLDKVGTDGIKLVDSVKNDGKMRKVLQTTVLLRNARGAV